MGDNFLNLLEEEKKLREEGDLSLRRRINVRFNTLNQTLNNISSESSSYVTLDTNQSLTGVKTFINTPVITENISIDDTNIYKAVNKKYCDDQINSIIGSAPETLNTLHKLSSALNNDADFGNFVISSLENKTTLEQVQSNNNVFSGTNTFNNNIIISENSSLNGLTPNVLNYLTGITSSVQTQLDTKANSNNVVDLSSNQTITGNKTFSNNLSVVSLNNISSTTLGYLSNVTDDIQTQLDSKMSSTVGGFVDLTTDQTILSGTKNWNNVNVFSRTAERINNLTLSGSTFTLDFSVSGLCYVVPSSGTQLTCFITNLPTPTDSNQLSFTVNLIINSGTHKTYVTALNINGTPISPIRFINGSSTINVDSAVWILQSITIFSLPNTALVALSSVSSWL